MYFPPPAGAAAAPAANPYAARPAVPGAAPNPYATAGAGAAAPNPYAPPGAAAAANPYAAAPGAVNPALNPYAARPGAAAAGAAPAANPYAAAAAAPAANPYAPAAAAAAPGLNPYAAGALGSPYGAGAGVPGAAGAAAAAAGAATLATTGAQMQTPPAPGTENPNQDAEARPDASRTAADDGISCVAWNIHNQVACATWDHKVRVYNVDNNGNAQARIEFPHDAPVLSVAWSPNHIFTGGCDTKVRLADPADLASLMVLGEHDLPVRSVNFCEKINAVVSGSWDKTVRVWDFRNVGTPSVTQHMSERVYAMDVKDWTCLVATADKNVTWYDLRNPNRAVGTLPSPLDYQTRCVGLFPDCNGFAIGSIEGRVGVQYFNQRDSSKNFAFKAHRKNDYADVFAVNAISFTNHGTFGTAGADGSFHFWDKDSKQRLAQFPKRQELHGRQQGPDVFLPGPISAAAFNPTSTWFAYAASYDWSEGIEGYNPAIPNRLFLHRVNDNEIRARRRGRR